MRLVAAIVMTLVSGQSLAQAPGYMGRRLVFAADVSFMNAMFNPNTNYNSGFGSLNYRAGFDIDYVVSRNGSVGLTFEVINSAMEYERWSSDRFSDPLVPEGSGNHDFGSITGEMYGINYKHFNHPSRGGIAPVGAFGKFAVGMMRTVVTPVDLSASTTYGKSWEFLTPVLTLGYGRQRVIWNALVIRAGVEFGVVPTGLFPAISGNNRIQHNDPIAEMRRFHDARLFGYYMINAKFGIGFLAPFRHRPK